MVGFRKLTVSTCALLALVALKIYIDMTYTFPFDADRQPAASHAPGNLVAELEALQGQDNRSTAKLHSLAQRLRKTVVASDALWNRKELQLLDSKGLTAWTCRSDKDSIKDLAAYPHALQHFLLHGGCRNHPTLIDQPSKCSPNKTFLLLAIKSSPQNFAQRQAVRNSWGSERDYGGRPVRLVFLLGVAPGPDLSPLLSYENGRFHDLLQWDFMDTFFNLTVKDQMFLGWARARCPGAAYILKGDDDVFVRTPDVVRQLSSMTGQKPRALYMGDVVMAANPYRDPRSKYYIPPSYYVGSYPPYAGGGGYVFSGILVPWLYLVSQFVAPFPIDDVYAGMCFMALGVRPVGNPRFRTFETPGGREVLKCPKQRLLLVHRKSPQEILKMWGQLTDNVAQC
ncbi:UDP-GlcNAc:betaGal beta-1,3-N-acetylglucosaminyltransferase 8 [Spea bombifrons]|uniref:UDP-GlcNAc:betaGal beta-1,3-N-acetylglucosaminyltransferase 8 n=1 Tax=Spea bombifrons TaxID=233779 RepID=UPI00234A918E|nr:UDP-GlcNAc:betaGal beta-1,3-N-acetylglucosaminyltransferase 8 [Spea bombifrons]